MELHPFIADLNRELELLKGKVAQDFEVVIAPPATHLLPAVDSSKNTAIQIGAQNCGHAKSGAFTGEISPQVLKEIHCEWVILGHSERRHLYLEDDARILGRLKAAWDEQLKVILCVGETLPERKGQRTTQVVERQLQILREASGIPEDRLVVAYEPVWAIGTGENATPDQAQEVHQFIRNWLKSNFSNSASEKTRILYGGSVKPDNSQELMGKPDVDGFLVGGASLEVSSFLGIIKNAFKSRG
ncbi:MAG: triose-phosphate isomerase [Proteobacteria bacterium]|nr:triose-phosphate isomerase [Pseudomonadota bacterium]NDD05602.1 triose-phosphate isomerase [Pseudomonadota bacterium]